MIRLERELALSEARALDAESRLQDLVYVASHDLIEPLRMVTSFLGLLERRNAEKFDERSREFLAFAVDGADRMKILIDDLLRYSRAGTGTIDRRPVALGSLLTGAGAKLRRQIAEQEATITLDDDLPQLDVDAASFTLLLQSLLANAITFRPTERGNRVHVSAERSGDAWEVRVSDDGIGFEPSAVERIFKPFQRLHARDEYVGTGIGLAICQRIAERHGGDVRASSRPGDGACFTVRVPDGAGA